MIKTSTMTRLMIASLVFLMTNAVIFGFGMFAVLSIPALLPYAETLVPLVVFGSFLISAPVAWMIAPRLRARYWRKHKPDFISGGEDARKMAHYGDMPFARSAVRNSYDSRY